MKFSDLFAILPNGNASPKQTIKMGNLFMGAGSSISRNVTMNGVNLAASWDKELSYKIVEGVVVVDAVTG
jgi:hypothetical protein